MLSDSTVLWAVKHTLLNKQHSCSMQCCS